MHKSIMFIFLALVSFNFLDTSGEAVESDIWETRGLCYFDSIAKECRVLTSLGPDARIHAWNAKYQLTWKDGLQQIIVVGSDVRASIEESGVTIAAEQMPTDADQLCKIQTTNGHTIKFDSGRLTHVHDQGGC